MSGWTHLVDTWGSIDRHGWESQFSGFFTLVASQQRSAPSVSDPVGRAQP
jgi:hypothetical protein